jgi:catechol 2,3-dioxygenase
MATRTDALPATTTLGPVHLQVADLIRSLQYYTDVLGLRPVQRTGGAATLAAQRDPTSLVVLKEHPGAVPSPRRGRLGLYHYAILLPDRASLGRFVSHLDRLGVRVGASDHLVSEALYLTDPDGLGIEVYADRPRNGWRLQDGELAMATDPLDLDDLVRAAGGEPWTGMPPGARVGHVHLHVGDLARAAAFYEALGLEATVRGYPGALFLSAGGYHHHLGLNIWAGPAALPARPGDAQLLEWTIIVPNNEDAASAARRVEGSGFAVTPTPEGWVLTDPWGTVVRVASAAPALDAARREGS